VIECTRGLVLPYLASFLLVAPAVVNIILVVLWRGSSDPQTTLRGRCGWDIDVVWSGVGLVCDRSPSFASWLGGAVSRLCITILVLVRPPKLMPPPVLARACDPNTSFPFQITYHVVLYKYRTVCQDAEIVDRGPYTRFPKSVYVDRRKSITTAGSGGTRTSRPQSFADRPGSISPPPDVHPHLESMHRTQPSVSDETTQMISRVPTRDEIRMPEGLASSSSSHTTTAESISPLYEDTDLHNFVDRFRRMVHQAVRDTEDGLGRTSPENSEESDRVYSSSEGEQHEFDPYVEANLLYDTNGRQIEVSVNPTQVQVFGRMVHRMPTITSIGSGERSSRAPSRAYSGHPPHGERSLPSSRSNTAENEVTGPPLPRQIIR